mmetsp:Transcript_135369/g.350804  ORF Transcript_135369/g.350804 Transcript_135369/m.350804 type:complete len:225 (+) Transcript_135369:2349-3023(+)
MSDHGRATCDVPCLRAAHVDVSRPGCVAHRRHPSEAHRGAVEVTAAEEDSVVVLDGLACCCLRHAPLVEVLQKATAIGLTSDECDCVLPRVFLEEGLLTDEDNLNCVWELGAIRWVGAVDGSHGIHHAHRVLRQTFQTSAPAKCLEPTVVVDKEDLNVLRGRSGEPPLRRCDIHFDACSTCKLGDIGLKVQGIWVDDALCEVPATAALGAAQRGASGVVVERLD